MRFKRTAHSIFFDVINPAVFLGVILWCPSLRNIVRHHDQQVPLTNVIIVSTAMWYPLKQNSTNSVLKIK